MSRRVRPAVSVVSWLLRLLAGPVLLAAFTGVTVAAMMLVLGEPGTRTYTYRTPEHQTPLSGKFVANEPSAAASKAVGVTDLGGPSLAPGKDQQRFVRLANPNDHDVVVADLQASVGPPVDGTDLPIATCPATALQLQPPAGPVTVRAMSTVDVAITARLAVDAPAACQLARFPVTFTLVS
jgi:hypothetical protein